jgi:hypothetical protein
LPMWVVLHVNVSWARHASHVGGSLENTSSRELYTSAAKIVINYTGERSRRRMSRFQQALNAVRVVCYTDQINHFTLNELSRSLHRESVIINHTVK